MRRRGRGHGRERPRRPHRRPHRPRLRGLLGGGAALRRAAGVRPLRAAGARPGPCPGPPCRGPARRPTRGRSSLDARRLRAPGRRHPRRHRRRRRLPGEPHPPALRAAARRRRRSPPSVPRWPAATRRRSPRWSSCRRPGVRRGVGVARAASSAAQGDRVRVLAHQGHRRPGHGLHRQGPGRERDDRRPRPQRPRPGLRVGLGAGAGAAAPSRTTPASSTSCQHRRRASCAPGVGWAELLDATFPPGSVTGAPKLAALDHIARLEPVAPGRLLRRGRLGRRRPAPRASSTSPSARSGSRTTQLHLGTGGGITWDSTAADEWAETELKATRLLAVASPAGTARGRRGRRGGPMSHDRTTAWFDGAPRRARRRRRATRRPRLHHRRRRLRDAPRARPAVRRSGRGTPPGWPGRWPPPA